MEQEDKSYSSKTCLSHGSISVNGRKRAMEDAVMVVSGVVDCGGGSYDFFGVYDGHGGAKDASECRDKMHKMLVAAVESNKSVMEGNNRGLKYWEEVMRVSLANMDKEVQSVVEGEVEMEAMRSTVAVVLVDEEEIVVANCGNSRYRVVLCRDGVAIPLSIDHELNRNEREQVEAASGQVLNWNADYYLKPCVISEPEVTLNKRIESDEFLVIATNGLWDVVSKEMACEIVRKCLSGERCSAEAAGVLAKFALGRGSKDSIGVIVVELKG